MIRYDDRDVIITNLIDSYIRLMDFVRKHTNNIFYLRDGMQVEEVRDNLAREVCVNLLIHRELTDGTTSRIIITKDAIYTENPSSAKFKGFLDINNYIPYSKNPKIAKVFREIGLADELGSGVRKIIEYAHIYSGKEPILEEGDIFKLTIPLSKDKNAQENIQNAQENIQNAQEKQKITEQSIIDFCEEPKSLKEIISHFGYRNSRSFREYYIKPLIKNNKLKMTIPENPNNRNQKYICK